nr:hypothetical protein [Tanacetum cinerariifolium]
NDQFPPTDRSNFTHEEFADELAHIISPLEYDCFYFRNLPDPGELISILNSGIRKNPSSTTRVRIRESLMDIVAKLNDPQCESLLLHACASISKLYFSMHTCSTQVFEQAQHSFNAALCSSLECIIIAFSPGFSDSQWRLSTFPFAFGGLGVYSAGDVLNYAFLTSRLQSAGLQSKLLRDSNIVTFGPAFANALRDIYGDYVVSCTGVVGIKHRHNIVRGTLVDICFWSGSSACKEVDIGLGGGRDKPLHPTDMLLYSSDGGLDVCVDLTGSSPLTRTWMIDFDDRRCTT